MNTWIRTNAIGFPLILLTAALILVTITWPSRRENLEFRDPVATAAVGTTLSVEGTTWRVEPIDPDLSKYSALTNLDDHPENSTTLVYLVTVDGANPDFAGGCAPVATDGHRRWGVVTLAGVRTWAVDQGYSGFCRLDKSFVVAFQVPDGTHITAVDFMISPPAEGDAVAATSRGHVIRFLVD